jgi:hypothetical protein
MINGIAFTIFYFQKLLVRVGFNIAIKPKIFRFNMAARLKILEWHSLKLLFMGVAKYFGAMLFLGVYIEHNTKLVVYTMQWPSQFF